MSIEKGPSPSEMGIDAKNIPAERQKPTIEEALSKIFSVAEQKYFFNSFNYAPPVILLREIEQATHTIQDSVIRQEVAQKEGIIKNKKELSDREFAELMEEKIKEQVEDDLGEISNKKQDGRFMRGLVGDLEKLLAFKIAKSGVESDEEFAEILRKFKKEYEVLEEKHNSKTPPAIELIEFYRKFILEMFPFDF